MSVFKKLVETLESAGTYVDVDGVARELDAEVVDTRTEQGGRWHYLEYTTLKFGDNKFFEVCIEEPATEMQERGTISVYKVKPRAVTKIKYDKTDIGPSKDWSLE